ncbi:MAG: oxaloacetate decarboxylase, partial [Bacteroidaceae bacterium]|nr:oxaloacetate decarboxylase [Bacteroidaceae bacterium]
ELVELAKKQGREFTDADPHTLLKPALPGFIKEMEDNGWERGQDDEELYELAMHPEQYRNYKSGQAKKNFLADLDKAKMAKLQASAGPKMSLEELSAFKHAKADAITAPENGQLLFEVSGDAGVTRCTEPAIGSTYKAGETVCYLQTQWGQIIALPAALGGTLVDVSAHQGQHVVKGQAVAWIERG